MTPDFNFPDKTIVPILFKEIIDSNMMVYHGSTLDDFVFHFEGEPWWDNSLDVNDIILSESFKKGLEKWLHKRYDYAIKLFKEDIKEAGGWPVPAIRVMNKEKEWINTLTKNQSIGVFWAVYIPNYKNHSAYGGDLDDNKVEFFMHSKITPDMINWIETLKSRMDYLNGDTEMEIQLHKDAEINLHKIEDAFGNVLEINESQYKS